MPGYVNHDVWKTRKKNPEIRLAEAIKDIVSEAIQEAKTKEENEKGTESSTKDTVRYVRASSWEDKYGTGDLYCSNCGSIIEKDELLRHNWYYCYHCGNKMINPYGGKSAVDGSGVASGRYLYQTEKEN